MVFPDLAVHRAIYRGWRRSGDAPMELADSVVSWMGSIDLMESSWITGSLPYSFRRPGWPRESSLELPTAHGRKVGANESRGAREISPKYACALWEFRLASRSTSGSWGQQTGVR